MLQLRPPRMAAERRGGAATVREVACWEDGEEDEGQRGRHPTRSMPPYTPRLYWAETHDRLLPRAQGRCHHRTAARCAGQGGGVSHGLAHNTQYRQTHTDIAEGTHRCSPVCPLDAAITPLAIVPSVWGNAPALQQVSSCAILATGCWVEIHDPQVDAAC